MLIATTDDLRGKQIAEVLGLVRGNTVRARHVGRDILAGLRNIIGGEIGQYSGLLTEARQQATDRMIKEAEALGANAIVGARYSTSGVMGGAAELLAYGTAVRIEETGAGS
jgi:uncharacterized protein YbjQ (UPF0145 family)